MIDLIVVCHDREIGTMIVWLMWLICGIVVAVSCQSRSGWAPGLCRAKLTVLCLQVIYHFGPAIHFFCLSLLACLPTAD